MLIDDAIFWIIFDRNNYRKMSFPIKTDLQNTLRVILVFCIKNS